MIIIGSVALHHNGINIVPKDIDVIATFSEWNDYYHQHKNIIESSIGLHGKVQVVFDDGLKMEVVIKGFDKSDDWLYDHIDEMKHEFIPYLNAYAYIPSLELLFLMKKSHVHCDSLHFEKTIQHYTMLRDMMDEQSIDEDHWDFYKLRKNEAEKRYKHRTPSLNMTNDEFFDRSKDAVGYVFVHDSIHEAIKHFDVPVYEMMKRDFEQAKCEKDMFFELPYETRIKCVQEEAYVIAIERYLLLDGTGSMTPYIACKNALQRICTTLCSGFFRQFAIDNYYAVMDAYDETYIRRFERGYNDGTVYAMDGISHNRIEQVMLTYIDNTNL